MEQKEYQKIVAEIVDLSEEWKTVINDKWQELDLDVNFSNEEDTLLQRLLDLFDNSELSDVAVYRKLQREDDLHVSISCNNLAKCRRAHNIMGLTFDLCSKIFASLPSKVNELPKEGDFSFPKGEQAVVRIYRHQNATMIEVMVKTEEIEADELLYWSKDKIFIMSFAPEFDEYHPASPRPLTFI